MGFSDCFLVHRADIDRSQTRMGTFRKEGDEGPGLAEYREIVEA